MMKILLSSFFLIFLIVMSPLGYAQDVPDWVKNTAGWWATDAISETEFVNAIEYLVNNGIIDVDSTSTSSNVQPVPDWVKNTAGWWATDAISETEFVNAIEYLVNNGIIVTEKLVTEKFVTLSELEYFFNQKVIDERGPQKNLLTPVINSHGFRGPEINQLPSEDTFRIFAVGGSTTFGIGAPDGNSWPALLREKFASIDTQKNVEIINAGIPSATSYNNFQLIKNKLVTFEPDLLIIYEGVNEQVCSLPEYSNSDTQATKEFLEQLCGVYAQKNYPDFLANRYSDICDFGKKNNFDVVLIIQPTVMFEGKILTDQELSSYFDRSVYSVMLYDYENLTNTVLTQTTNCYSTVSFVEIFDDYDIPIYFDYMHSTHVGNDIISEHILEEITPLLITEGIFTDSNVKSETRNIFNFKFKDAPMNKDFSKKTIDNESFLGMDLSGTDFSNSVISNSDFRLTNLESADFSNTKLDGIQFRQNILKNADFTNVDFTNVDLTNVDLSETKLVNTKLSSKNLTQTFFHKADLSGASMSNSLLHKVFFNDVKIKDVDFTHAHLKENSFVNVYDKDVNGMDFTKADIEYADFHGLKLTNTIFDKTIVHNSNFVDTDFSQVSSIVDISLE